MKLGMRHPRKRKNVATVWGHGMRESNEIGPDFKRNSAESFLWIWIRRRWNVNWEMGIWLFMCICTRNPRWNSANRLLVLQGQNLVAQILFLVFMYVYAYICVHEYMHVYMYVYIYIYIYIYISAQEWRNRTVAEHACSKMQILCFTKTKWVQ